METSLEELNSTNEELQSTNEELQSINEEAMTNKEEMLSINEALLHLNAQYLAKTEEMTDVANDIKNLLDATDIGVIFLDHDLIIKRFTPSVTPIIPLLPTDIGRPITHFAATLRYEGLAADVQTVLDRLTPVENTMQVPSGEWYALRIVPYRTLDNYIRGAVITFTAVTAHKHCEEELEERIRFTDTLQAAVREPVVVFDADLRVYFANRAFADLLAVAAPAELVGQPLAQLGGGFWNQPALREQLQRLLAPADADPAEPVAFDQLPLTVELPGRSPHRVLLYGRPLRHGPQAPGRALLGVEAVELIPATAA